MNMIMHVEVHLQFSLHYILHKTTGVSLNPITSSFQEIKVWENLSKPNQSVYQFPISSASLFPKLKTILQKLFIEIKLRPIEGGREGPDLSYF